MHVHDRSSLTSHSAPYMDRYQSLTAFYLYVVLHVLHRGSLVAVRHVLLCFDARAALSVHGQHNQLRCCLAA